MKNQPALRRRMGGGSHGGVRGEAMSAERSPASREQRWQSLCVRDRSLADSFVYAVTTTGIYCRPNCPSRRPRRRHVRFFDSAREAEAAGFRACKRCRPGTAWTGDAVPSKVLEACRYIQGCKEGPPKLAEIGAHVGLSPFHLQRVFKRVLGLTPRQYASALRIERLKAARPVDCTSGRARNSE
jgi:AraC family transcriptional regulator of adaptative response/methylated-DNA-[protein]-cysteine methyltransferase